MGKRPHCSMRIAVIIPDRGDRPAFLANCLRMVRGQTLKPAQVILVNDPPITTDKDITWRYRIGYGRVAEDIDLVAFMENDDWYSRDYLKTMAQQWMKAKCPDIFGTSYTIYYHIGLRKWFTMHHSHRSSAMSTVIRPCLPLTWPTDNDPYTDQHLWRNVKGRTFTPEKHICLGMKHGVGLCGGVNHFDAMHRYTNDDGGLLADTLDPESLKFYSQWYTPPSK
jgi:glycosyltransferase involved in cell wall biosynthesis